VHTGRATTAPIENLLRRCAAVCVQAGIPCVTEPGWDFGWLMPRTDGAVARWLCDPYTLAFARARTAPAALVCALTERMANSNRMYTEVYRCN